VREKSRKVGELQFSEGEWMEPVVFVIEHFGAPSESVWPYAPNQTKRVRGLTWKRLDGEAAKYKARCFRLEDFDDIVPHLEVKHPIIAVVDVHNANGWHNPRKDGTIDMPNPGEPISGRHVIVLVARNAQGYRFANLWGTAWADRGFGMMSEATARVLIDQKQMWAIEVLFST
jgi:hypothetical protein